MRNEEDCQRTWMRLLGATLLMAPLIGCASSFGGSPKQRLVGEDPPLHSRTQRSVGDEVYETYNYWSGMVARIDAPLAIDRMLFQGTLPRGYRLDESRSEDRTLYCDPQQTLRQGFPICLSDQDGNGAFETWRILNGPRLGPPQRLKAEIPFTVQEAMDGAEGFKYELLYQGLSGDVVRLLYREYVDNMARAAFHQELSYTLAASGATDVSFRDIKVRIFSADNNSIDYEVLQGLEAP